MTTLTLHASGRAHVDEVWARYEYPERWPQWAPQISAVTASAERIAPGVTGRVHGPLGVAVAFTIDSVEATAKRWAWTVRFGPLTLHLQHGVLERPAGSRAWLTVTGPLPVIATYAPIARFALGRLVAR